MREALQKERDEIKGLLGGLQEGLKVSAEGDDLEKMLAFSSREQTARDLERLQTRLIEVEGALGRLNQSFGFGVCVECGEPISVKRLTAVPWAKKCIKCQESSEVKRN